MKKKAGGWSSLPKAVKAGVRKALSEETPLLLAPVNWALKHTIGPKKVSDFYWKYLQKPITKADMFLGSAAQKGVQKASFGKLEGKLFESPMLLPMKRAKGRSTGRVEYQLPSVMAPAKKATGFLLPILGAMKAEELLKGTKNMSSKPKINEADLRKTAEVLLELKDQRDKLTKEAKATELLYKQAELGQIRFPATFADYQEKVAELLSKDLKIVEEAIKMASSNENESLGGLERDSVVASDPRTAFQRSIIDN